MGGRAFAKGPVNKMSGGEKASLTDKFVTPMGKSNTLDIYEYKLTDCSRRPKDSRAVGCKDNQRKG